MAGSVSMKQIQVYLPITYLHGMDILVEEKKYPNRAELVRLAVRDLLSTEFWNRP